LTQIFGQLHTRPLIGLSLLVKRYSIGSPADLLPSGLTVYLISDPPDTASLFSFENATDLSWSLFGSHREPSAVSLAKPTPEPTPAVFEDF
jgi:hypothetical protein